MATATSSFNPYQAPNTPAADASLAADTEFLFNDKVVAGAGTILLPRVCVVSGSTDSLLARESRLWWCTRWITTPTQLLVFGALFVLIPMMLNLPPGAARLSASTSRAEWLQLIFGAGLIFGVRHAGLGIFVAPSIWIFASVVRLVRGNRVLYVADQQDGLFLIGGLSEKFLTETKRMADEYTARTGSSAAGG